LSLLTLCTGHATTGEFDQEGRTLSSPVVIRLARDVLDIGGKPPHEKMGARCRISTVKDSASR
jgi:hypothetical protein